MKRGASCNRQYSNRRSIGIGIVRAQTTHYGKPPWPCYCASPPGPAPRALSLCHPAMDGQYISRLRHPSSSTKDDEGARRRPEGGLKAARKGGAKPKAARRRREGAQMGRRESARSILAVHKDLAVPTVLANRIPDYSCLILSRVTCNSNEVNQDRGT
jgi:hypothetical protein